MISWRHFNPMHSMRLERELETARKHSEGQQRGIRSLVDSIHRQAGEGTETALRCKIELLEARRHAIDIAITVAIIELDRGRPQLALNMLKATMSEAPAGQFVDIVA